MIIGDMSIKDLTPKTTNLGDRLVKNLRMCGSGIYTYHKSEIPLLNVGEIPSQYKDLEYFNVYRSPKVLIDNKDKFARVPIITGSHVLVNQSNAKQLAVGMIGDSVVANEEADGETYLYTTGTIIAGDGVRAYEDYGQLSVGYDPIMKWESGNHNGIDYQIVLEGFNDVNHVLICKTARGGSQCMIMDSTDNLSSLRQFIIKNGGAKVNFFSKIFGNKKVAGDSVSLLLDTIAMGANAEQVVDKIRAIAGDSIKKNEDMDGFLSELACAKGADEKELKEAVEIVKGKWQSLMGDEEPKEVEKEKEEPKKEVGDEEPKEDEPKKEVGDEEPKEEEPKKETAGDAIDYDRIINGVVAKMKEANEKVDTAINGDSLSRLGVAITGDETKSVSSDDIMKTIWG